MRIGIDLDGCGYGVVRAHREAAIRQGYKESQLRVVEQWNYWNDWGMTREEWQATADHGVDGYGIFWHGQPESGFKEALIKWRADGHSLHIVTNRTWGNAPIAATEYWLNGYEIPFDSLTFAADKTVVPCDVFFEDNVPNLEALSAAGVTAVAYDQLWNQEFDGLRVYGWDDAEVLMTYLVHNAAAAKNVEHLPAPKSQYESIKGIS